MIERISTPSLARVAGFLAVRCAAQSRASRLRARARPALVVVAVAGLGALAVVAFAPSGRAFSCSPPSGPRSCSRCRSSARRIPGTGSISIYASDVIVLVAVASSWIRSTSTNRQQRERCSRRLEPPRLSCSSSASSSASYAGISAMARASWVSRSVSFSMWRSPEPLSACLRSRCIAGSSPFLCRGGRRSSDRCDLSRHRSLADGTRSSSPPGTRALASWNGDLSVRLAHSRAPESRARQGSEAQEPCTLPSQGSRPSASSSRQGERTSRTRRHPADPLRRSPSHRRRSRRICAARRPADRRERDRPGDCTPVVGRDTLRAHLQDVVEQRECHVAQGRCRGHPLRRLRRPGPWPRLRTEP